MISSLDLGPLIYYGKMCLKTLGEQAQWVLEVQEFRWLNSRFILSYYGVKTQCYDARCEG